MASLLCFAVCVIVFRLCDVTHAQESSAFRFELRDNERTCFYQEWAEVRLFTFAFKVIRGGKTYQHEKGDVCFDDFEIELRDCHLGELRKRANHDITCTCMTSLSRHHYSFNTNQRHRVPLRFRGGLVY